MGVNLRENITFLTVNMLNQQGNRNIYFNLPILLVTGKWRGVWDKVGISKAVRHSNLEGSLEINQYYYYVCTQRLDI